MQLQKWSLFFPTSTNDSKECGPSSNLEGEGIQNIHFPGIIQEARKRAAQFDTEKSQNTHSPRARLTESRILFISSPLIAKLIASIINE